MSEPFKPIPVVGENTHVDRFGNSLNVGDRVLLATEQDLVEGVISSYEHLWYNVIGVFEHWKADLQIMERSVHHYGQRPPVGLVNINSLPILDPVKQAEIEALIGPYKDLTDSASKKCSRKYIVALVGDHLKDHHTSSTKPGAIDKLQVIITSIPGSTEADWRRFDKYLADMYEAKVISLLCSSNERHDSWGMHADDKRKLHNWDVYQFWQYDTDWVTKVRTPRNTHISRCSVPQSVYQLSKKRLQEYGLFEHLDTAMSVAEFNQIVATDGKWKYFE